MDFNDEIVSIEEIGIRKTIDIEVDSEDHIFVCNEILTKNSIGLPQTLDLYFALMTNDVLAKSNRIAVKQLKNRYRDENKNRYFTLGLDKPKMRFYHVDDWNADLSPDQKEDITLADDDTFESPLSKKYKVSSKDKFSGINI